MGVRYTKAKAPWVGTSGGGSGEVFDADQGIYYDDTNDLLSLQVIPFWDTFTESKPFWNDTQVLDSGDFQIDTGNEWLEGIAENNAYDYYRYGIEGDYDHAIKVDVNDATSAGFRIYDHDESTLQRLIILPGSGGTISAELTGKSNVSVTGVGLTMWLRVTRRKNVLGFYYRTNDTDAWTLLASYSDVSMSYGVNAAFDSSNGAEIHEVLFYDNTMSQRLMATGPKSVDLGNISGNVNIDARRGNVFYGVLTGNITLQNPTNPIPWQMIIFCLEQDADGSNTIAFDTAYNFSTDLPSPTLSTTGTNWDYLGFIYNPKQESWDYIAEVFDFS